MNNPTGMTALPAEERLLKPSPNLNGARCLTKKHAVAVAQWSGPSTDGFVSIAIWATMGIKRITTEGIQNYECKECGDRYWGYNGDQDADCELWRDRHNSGKHSFVAAGARLGNSITRKTGK